MSSEGRDRKARCAEITARAKIAVEDSHGKEYRGVPVKQEDYPFLKTGEGYVAVTRGGMVVSYFIAAYVGREMIPNDPPISVTKKKGR